MSIENLEKFEPYIIRTQFIDGDGKVSMRFSKDGKYVIFEEVMKELQQIKNKVAELANKLCMYSHGINSYDDLDLIKYVEQKLRQLLIESCKECKGSGKAFANGPPSNYECEACNGTGKSVNNS